MSDWLSVAMVLSVAWLLARAFFESYMRKKGENLATKEDIAALVEQVRLTTRATEEIKASISGEIWLAQEKWKLKRDAYLGLLDSFESVAVSLLEGRLLGKTPQQQAELFRKALERDSEKYPNRAAETRRAKLVARLFMRPEAFEAILTLTSQVGAIMKTDHVATGTDELTEIFDSHRRAFDAILEAGKADLALSVPEGNQPTTPHTT